MFKQSSYRSHLLNVGCTGSASTTLSVMKQLPQASKRLMLVAMAVPDRHCMTVAKV